MTSTGYESWETRRDASLRKKASIAADAIAEVQEQIAAQEGGLNEALEQARLALEIVNDPNGPVQQAVSESAAARDEARDAVTAVEAATEDVAEALAAADEAVTQASLAKTTADGKNKIYRAASADDFPLESELTPGDLLYFINPATFGEVFEEVLYVYVWDGEAWGIYQMVAGSVLVPSSVGTISLADGAVTAPKVIAGAITTEKLQAGAVDTSKLQAGAVTTEKLDAGSVTAAKMVIAENDNLIPDPNFAGFDSDGSSWVTSDGGWYVSRSDDTAVLRHQGPYGGDWIIIRSQEFVVSRGDDLLVRCDWINSLPRAAKIGIMYFDSLGEAAGSSMVESSATGWQKTVIETTVPENARTAYFRYAVLSPQAGDSGATMFGRPQVLRRASGELIVDGAITARKIQAGAITAEKIQAGAVNTSKLTVGDFTNLVDDPDFMNPSESWGLPSTVTVVDTTGGPGKALRFTPTGGGSNYAWNGNVFPVKQGDRFLLAARVQNAFNTGNLTVGIQFLDEGEVSINDAGSMAFGISGWADKSTEVVVPADAFYGRFYAVEPSAATSGDAWVSKPRVLRMSTGEMIVNGSISTDKLDARAVTADKIATRNIYAGHISAGTITANEINTGSIRAEILKANVVKATHIDADAINGKTITGATIQSKSPSGSTYPARSVVMSPTGVDVFGSNAIQVTRIDYRGIYATPSNGSGMYPVRPTFAGTAKRSSPGSVTVSAIITSGTPISVTAGPNCTARITARSADTFTINIQKYDTSSFVNSYEAYWMAAP